MVAISSSLFLVSALERPMDLREANFMEEPGSFLPVRFLRYSFWWFPFGLNHSHGRDEEERLEGCVGLSVEIFSVAKQPRTLGGEQRAGLLLREELERGGDEVGGDEDEEAHLLVALEAGEGLVLALGGSRRPAGTGADERTLFEFAYSHGECGGAEDLLVLHLVVGHEQGNCRL